jgi:phenylalanyl-tRNA synthetase beta chain
MKLTLGWLRRHLETEAPLAAICDRLVGLGHEVEEVIDRAKDLAPFTVALVVAARPHPNADRLSVCTVDTGAERIEVVCGAPNARAGMKGVFARIGTVIPGTGLELKRSEIRGVASHGMLCSEREMGLGQDHDGIIELSPDAPVGRPFAEVMGLDDPVLDLKITPDRADCFGVRGIARDLAAAGLGRLKSLEIAPVPGRFASPIAVDLRFDEETASACPLFLGRHIRGLANRPSPRWLADKLSAIGLRPISALVDITNWLTVDLNRPVHAFDAGKIAGPFHVRLARPGESIAALNGKTYALDPSMTVICDSSGPLSLGGIMGGSATGCGPDTTEVFLEIALFDPVRTAATGRKLALESDARQRFERGLDPQFAGPGMEEATRLVLELCGGEASHVVVAGAAPPGPPPVAFRPSRVAGLGGLAVEPAKSRRLLESLGCRIAADEADRWAVLPPTWRHDLAVEADLVEEVLRLEGFEAIPPVSLPRSSPLTRPMLTQRQARARRARRRLAARGLMEAVTWSFLPRAHAELFAGGGGANPELRLANPISAELDWMRPSGLPNLIAACRRNADRGFDDIGLFEVGPAYADATTRGQSLLASAVRRGQTGPRHWASPPRPVDAMDAKADALSVLAACGVSAASLRAVPGGPAWYHPGRSGEVRQGSLVLAHFGELHPNVLAAMDVEGPLVGCEVMLDAVPDLKERGGRTRPPLDAPSLLPVARDFAFVVAASVAAEKIVKAAKGADRALVADVAVFDVYRGKGLPPGHVSIAIAVTLQPRERTLTEKDIEAVSAKIVAAVAKATGGVLRT